MTISRQKPNLFVVGAPKCGTTAWSRYLPQHGQIAFAARKEPGFFNPELPGFQWTKSLEDYLAEFAHAGDAKIVADGSVFYLSSEGAAQRIDWFDPEAKIVIFTRERAAWFHSFHEQLLYTLDEDIENPRRAWELSTRRSEHPLPPSCRDAGVLDYKRIGAFGEQAARFAAVFPPERMVIIRFEDWVKDAPGTYAALLEFLDLEPDGEVAFEKENAARFHKSRTLAGVTQRPPKFASKITGALRKLPGMKNFRPLRWLKQKNSAQGYQTKPDEGLDQSIRDFFAEDERLLAELAKRYRLPDRRGSWEAGG